MPRWDLLCAKMGFSTSCCSSSGDFVCLWLSVPPPHPCTRWCFYKSLGFTEPQRVRPSPAELQAAALRAGTLRTHPAAHTAAFFLHLCNRDDKSTGRRGSGGPGGGQQEAHTDPPAVVPGCCRLCPCPLELFCAPQAGQIGSACSQEGWHGTRGELQDVPLRGANGAGKRQGSGAVAVPRWQPLGLEVWVAQSGWGLSEAS